MHYYFHVPSVILTIEQTNEIATFAYTNYAQQGIKRFFKTCKNLTISKYTDNWDKKLWNH